MASSAQARGLGDTSRGASDVTESVDRGLSASRAEGPASRCGQIAFQPVQRRRQIIRGGRMLLEVSLTPIFVAAD